LLRQRYIFIPQIFLFLILSCSFLQAQNTDSLTRVILKMKDDSSKIKKQILLAEYYQKLQRPDSALKIFVRGIAATEKLDLPSLKLNLLARKALLIRESGNYLESNNTYFLAIPLAEKLNEKTQMSYCLNYVGSNYNDLGETNKALEFYMRSLKLKEELKDKRGISTTYNGLGLLFMQKEEWDEAIKYYSRSLQLKEELKDKRGIAICLNNLGNAHQAKDEFDQAFDYYNRSLKLKEEIGEKRSLTSTYANIGVIFKEKKEYDRAIEFYWKAANNDIENKITSGLVGAYTNLMNVYLIQKKYKEAEEVVTKAKEVAGGSGKKQDAMYLEIALTNFDSSKGDFKSAFFHKAIADRLEKSILKEQNRQSVTELLTQYESSKKEQQIAMLSKDKALQIAELEKQSVVLQQNKQNLLLLENENRIKELNLSKQKEEIEKKNILAENQQKNIEILNKDKALQEAGTKQKESQLKQRENVIYFVGSAGVLVLILLAVSYRGYVQKKKSNSLVLAQKKEVEEQKRLIELKQKEILDSIKYARRIQTSLMPTQPYLEKHLSVKTRTGPYPAKKS
jgi:tetratricopeptide (TPR) repeat protein